MPVSGSMFITETFAYDGGRPVTVFMPTRTPRSIVFAGDGQVVSQWGTLLEAAGAPRTMIVGVHRAADETSRLHEYSPRFDPQQFEAHERFFVNDVRRWIGARFAVRFPPARTAVFGASAGAELAIALGLRHPDLYGVILCASPGGGYRPPAGIPHPIPRAYFVGGGSEPFFLNHAIRWAEALRSAGGDVNVVERAGSHGDALWREEFPAMVTWAFAR